METKLSDDKKSVDFSFGGQLDSWQVKSILHSCNNNDEIREYLKNEKDGSWNDSSIDEFIEFKNSELINEMMF